MKCVLCGNDKGKKPTTLDNGYPICDGCTFEAYVHIYCKNPEDAMTLKKGRLAEDAHHRGFE